MTVGDGVPVPPPPVALNVEPMAPNLMFEKVTDAPADDASTSVGCPVEVAQVPRLIPGLLGSAVVGKLLSSHNISAA